MANIFLSESVILRGRRVAGRDAFNLSMQMQMFVRNRGINKCAPSVCAGSVFVRLPLSSCSLFEKSLLLRNPM